MTPQMGCCALLLLAGCIDVDEPPHHGDDDKADAGPQSDVLRTALDDATDLPGMAADNGAVKFLLMVEGAEPTPPIEDICVFQNTQVYPFHLQFLQALPGGEELTFDGYVANVITRATRVWWGGQLIFLSSVPHPLTDEPGVLVFSLYTGNTADDRLREDDVRAVFALLEGCAPFYEGHLVFQPTSDEQIQTMHQVDAALAADGIAVLYP